MEEELAAIALLRILEFAGASAKEVARQSQVALSWRAICVREGRLRLIVANPRGRSVLFQKKVHVQRLELSGAAADLPELLDSLVEALVARPPEPPRWLVERAFISETSQQFSHEHSMVFVSALTAAANKLDSQTDAGGRSCVFEALELRCGQQSRAEWRRVASALVGAGPLELRVATPDHDRVRACLEERGRWSCARARDQLVCSREGTLSQVPDFGSIECRLHNVATRLRQLQGDPNLPGLLAKISKLVNTLDTETRGPASSQEDEDEFRELDDMLMHLLNASENNVMDAINHVEEEFGVGGQ